MFETFKAYCAACGGEFRAHPTRGLVYHCSRRCWNEYEWRRTLAILGKPYRPLEEIPCPNPEGSGSASPEADPAPSAESPTGASSPPTTPPPSAPARRAGGISEKPGSSIASGLMGLNEFWIVGHTPWPRDPNCPTSPSSPTDSGGR